MLREPFVRLRLRRERAKPEAAVLLVRALDDAQALTQRVLLEARVARAGKWALEQRRDPEEACFREGQRVRPTLPADRAARPGGEAHERLCLPARGTARQMGKVAGEPEQLELEGEDERLERRLGRKRRLDVVQEVEEARKGVERRRLRLLLDEEPEHGLQADVAHGQPVGIRTRAVVRADELRPAHRMEVAPPLVEEELDVAQRLEAGAEPRPRLADSLRDRAHAPLL